MKDASTRRSEVRPSVAESDNLRDRQAAARVVRLEAPHVDDERVRGAEAAEVALHRTQPAGVLERLDQRGLHERGQVLGPACAREVVEPIAGPAARDAGAVEAGRRAARRRP